MTMQQSAVAPGRATSRPAADSATGVRQRRSRAAAGFRIGRQVSAIDAWHAARRQREAELLVGTGVSRLDREAARREVDVLRRVQQAVEARTASDLAGDSGPMLTGDLTAVIAHRHAWFTTKLTMLLQQRGVAVLACADNGADALGAVIAGQPDVLLTGDRLAMMTGADLLTWSRRVAPATRCALHTADVWNDRGREHADLVFLPQHSPADLADQVVGLLPSSPLRP